MPILYHVTIAVNDTRKLLHIGNCERFLCCHAAKDASERFTAYHFISGKKYKPDNAAILQALPHHWKRAFERATENQKFWYPVTLAKELTNKPEKLNSCSIQIFRANGSLIGTIYATPYNFK